MARIWDDILTDHDREIYRDAGFGAQGGRGERPALLVIDVTYDFVGDRPEPALESIKKFPMSCGEAGWRGMEAIRSLLEPCRDAGLPIFYTKGMDQESKTTRGSWTWKTTHALDRPDISKQIGNQIPGIVAPATGETVIQKTKPSAFFGTPLVSYLVERQVDTLLVTGCTTSGCVRASVIDAFSNNLRTIVVEEGVFDRGVLPHKANLFDMHSKYADVVSLEEAISYVRRLRAAPVGARS